VRLTWADDALDDLERIFDFNTLRSETLDDASSGGSWNVPQDLCANPRLGRPTRRRNRFRLSITDIRYVIDYEADAGVIRILRIQSTREIL